MVALFDAMDWVDEENDLSTAIGSGTRIASEIARDNSDNTPKLAIQTVSGKRYLEVDQLAIIDCTAHRPQQPHPHTSTRHMPIPLCSHPSSSQTSQHLIRKDRYTKHAIQLRDQASAITARLSVIVMSLFALLNARSHS
jgi:hypothetical protein